jgi:membrane-associated phospholipid phosphatase
VTTTPAPSLPTEAPTPAPLSRFVVATGGYLAVLIATYLLFVTTEAGQRFENTALHASTLRGDTARADSLQYLSGVSAATFLAAMGIVLLVALLRRRPLLGMVAVGVMGLSALAAEGLKSWVVRPELVEGPIWLIRNSFPSGTATIAAAVGLGALMVAPDRLRWLVLLVASLIAALIGQATQVTGWHRASDALGGVVLAASIASVGLITLAALSRTRPSMVGRVHPRVFGAIWAVAAAVITVGLTLLIALAAFPLLRAPDHADSVFLQTASNLVTFGLSIVAIATFAWIIEPYSLGAAPLRAETAAREARADDEAPARDVATETSILAGTAEPTPAPPEPIKPA